MRTSAGAVLLPHASADPPDRADQEQHGEREEQGGLDPLELPVAARRLVDLEVVCAAAELGQAAADTFSGQIVWPPFMNPPRRRRCRRCPARRRR